MSFFDQVIDRGLNVRGAFEKTESKVEFRTLNFSSPQDYIVVDSTGNRVLDTGSISNTSSKVITQSIGNIIVFIHNTGIDNIVLTVDQQVYTSNISEDVKVRIRNTITSGKPFTGYKYDDVDRSVMLNKTYKLRVEFKSTTNDQPLIVSKFISENGVQTEDFNQSLDAGKNLDIPNTFVGNTISIKWSVPDINTFAVFNKRSSQTDTNTWFYKINSDSDITPIIVSRLYPVTISVDNPTEGQYSAKVLNPSTNYKADGSEFSNPTTFSQTENVVIGTELQLDATPNPGYKFTGWSTTLKVNGPIRKSFKTSSSSNRFGWILLAIVILILIFIFYKR